MHRRIWLTGRSDESLLPRGARRSLPKRSSCGDGLPLFFLILRCLSLVSPGASKPSGRWCWVLHLSPSEVFKLVVLFLPGCSLHWCMHRWSQQCGGLWRLQRGRFSKASHHTFQHLFGGVAWLMCFVFRTGSQSHVMMLHRCSKSEGLPFFGKVKFASVGCVEPRSRQPALRKALYLVRRG